MVVLKCKHKEKGRGKHLNSKSIMEFATYMACILVTDILFLCLRLLMLYMNKRKNVPLVYHKYLKDDYTPDRGKEGGSKVAFLYPMEKPAP